MDGGVPNDAYAAGRKLGLGIVRINARASGARRTGKEHGHNRNVEQTEAAYRIDLTTGISGMVEMAITYKDIKLCGLKVRGDGVRSQVAP